MAVVHDPDRIRPGGSRRAGRWASALSGLGMTAGGLFAKVAAGFIGLAVVVGVVAPQPEADGRTRSQRGAQSPPANTIMLEVAEGELSGYLTVVDQSGRELATLTLRYDGEFGFVARSSGGAGVCCWLKDRAGIAFVNLFGTARRTLIDVQPDGRSKTAAGDLSERLERPGDPQRCGQDKEHGLTDAACVAPAHRGPRAYQALPSR